MARRRKGKQVATELVELAEGARVVGGEAWAAAELRSPAMAGMVTSNSKWRRDRGRASESEEESGRSKWGNGERC
jgi:hypothetical protein